MFSNIVYKINRFQCFWGDYLKGLAVLGFQLRPLFLLYAGTLSFKPHPHPFITLDVFDIGFHVYAWTMSLLFMLPA
jgi:hypothetical protein